MKKWLIVRLVLIVVLIVVPVIVLAGGCGGDDGDGEAPGEVAVPVNLEGAGNVGSISIELVYDSSVIEVTDVTAGELAANAMMEYNIDTSGIVIIGIVDSSGINGDGVVAELGFNIIDAEGTSSLTLDTVETHDATSLVDIINEPSDGNFAAEGNTVTAPVVRFVD